LFILLPANIIIKDVNAVRKLPTAIPLNNNVVIGTLLPILAILYTISITSTAHTNAIIDTKESPKKLNTILEHMPIAAPKAAPEDTPIT